MGKVIIVGGGYAGVALARRLDANADVILVEPRDAFIHNVAAIRALVDPSLLDKIILPYDNLLRRGRVLRDRAIAIGDNSILLQSGARLTAEVIAVATGFRIRPAVQAKDRQHIRFCVFNADREDRVKLFLNARVCLLLREDQRERDRGPAGQNYDADAPQHHVTRFVIRLSLKSRRSRTPLLEKKGISRTNRKPQTLLRGDLWGLAAAA